MSLYEIIKEEFKGLNISIMLNCREAAIFAYELYEDKADIYEESDEDLMSTLSENRVVVISRNHYDENNEEWFVEPLWHEDIQLFNSSDVFIIRDDVYDEVELDKLLDGVVAILEVCSEEDELCDMLCEDYEEDEYDYDDYYEEDECDGCEYCGCDCCDIHCCDEDDSEEDYCDECDYDVCDVCNEDECDGCFFYEGDIYEDEDSIEELVEEGVYALTRDDVCTHCLLTYLLEEAYALGYDDAVEELE